MAKQEITVEADAIEETSKEAVRITVPVHESAKLDPEVSAACAAAIAFVESNSFHDAVRKLATSRGGTSALVNGKQYDCHDDVVRVAKLVDGKYETLYSCVADKIDVCRTGNWRDNVLTDAAKIEDKPPEPEKPDPRIVAAEMKRFEEYNE